MRIVVEGTEYEVQEPRIDLPQDAILALGVLLGKVAAEFDLSAEEAEILLRETLVAHMNGEAFPPLAERELSTGDTVAGVVEYILLRDAILPDGGFESLAVIAEEILRIIATE